MENKKIFYDPLCEEFDKGKSIIETHKYFSIMFNNFPYVKGHIMIISNEHIENSLMSLTKDQRSELIELMYRCESVLKKCFNTDSINIGQNIGPTSGATIPEHFHIHLVPRQKCDVGFFNMFTHNAPRLDYRDNVLEAFKNLKLE